MPGFSPGHAFGKTHIITSKYGKEKGVPLCPAEDRAFAPINSMLSSGKNPNDPQGWGNLYLKRAIVFATSLFAVYYAEYGIYTLKYLWIPLMLIPVVYGVSKIRKGESTKRPLCMYVKNGKLVVFEPNKDTDVSVYVPDLGIIDHEYEFPLSDVTITERCDGYKTFVTVKGNGTKAVRRSSNPAKEGNPQYRDKVKDVVLVYDADLIRISDEVRQYITRDPDSVSAETDVNFVTE